MIRSPAATIACTATGALAGARASPLGMITPVTPGTGVTSTPPTPTHPLAVELAEEAPAPGDVSATNTVVLAGSDGCRSPQAAAISAARLSRPPGPM